MSKLTFFIQVKGDNSTMLKTVLTGLVAVAAITAVNSASASAATLDIPTPSVEDSAAVQLAVIIDETTTLEETSPTETPQVEEVQEIKHTVAENETLSDIAKKHNTTWRRIYDKNESLQSPDVINPGEEIVIPTAEEEVPPRALPEPPAPAPVRTARTQSATTAQQAAPAPAPRPRGSSAGNGYVYGYCTWYVKSVRSDLPNNLGNANTWAARARAQGFATGSTPRVGAVAQAVTGYMHVALVTAVNGDGTITVSEMNYNGWGVVSSRTAPASAFTYIY